MLRCWPVLPVLSLIYPAVHGHIMTHADDVIGYDAILCLLACLAVTPVITVAKAPIAKLRWWYGNWVFILGAAGLALHLIYSPGSVAYRSSGNAVDWSGTFIVVLLLPMAATSAAAAQKLLGPEWKRWQRGLVWFVWVTVAFHLLIMHSWQVLSAYLLASLPAVIIRQRRVRKSIRSWRANGYSTGTWWFILAILSALTLFGIAVLAAKEGQAIA